MPKEKAVRSDSLAPFFNPKGVVVVGASHEPTKLGYGLARNLVQSGYKGAVHFVNPKPGILLGKPIFPAVDVIPDPVDLAVLLVPPTYVPDTLTACGKRGIHAAIIATGGFRETGPEGAALEQKCAQIAHEYHIRLIGPNCIGLMDTHLPLDTTFLQPPIPPAGEIAFISHSGAICAAVIDWIKGQGIGLSHVISLGNQVDVNETDVLAPVAADPKTSVITMYLEGISSGIRFVEQARLASLKKPIIALKVGRFEAGKRAAASHTGALAGQETAFDAGFYKAGVIRANTSEEMFQWARALAWCPLPKGRRVAVLTNAGGPGVTASDALELNKLTLATLSEGSLAEMQKFLPAAASLRNPVDMLASATPEHYAECLRILLADPGVDSVMVISPPPPSSATGMICRVMIPHIQTSDKPVVVVLMGDKLIQEGVEMMRATHVPDYRFPEAAASALGALSQRADILARLGDKPVHFADMKKPSAAKLATASPAGQFMDQASANQILAAYKIPTVLPIFAADRKAATAVAKKMGFPVVLKLASPDISHKTDVGGVLLNLSSEKEVQDGFDLVQQRARKARPEARLEGVHLQRMLPPGQEVIVGMVRDPQFGAVVMFGSGGVEVEGLKDVAFALAPLTRSDAERLLDSTWAGKKLHGFRSLPAADRDAVIEVLLRLAQLSVDQPEIGEIEINPLRVLPQGQGAFAVDVRAKRI
ncbi:MAG: acetate--CoA ligase family protein [Anaerolineaceae bacterium]